MRCPTCQSDNHVVYDSRHTATSIRRRRKCEACGNRWVTFEVAQALAAAMTAFLRKNRDAGISA